MGRYAHVYFYCQFWDAMKYKLILNECTLCILMGMLRIVICWVFDACTQNAKSPALTNFQAFFVTVSNCLSNHFYLNNLVKMSRTHQSKHGNIIDVPEKMHNCSILYLESKMLTGWLSILKFLSNLRVMSVQHFMFLFYQVGSGGKRFRNLSSHDVPRPRYATSYLKGLACLALGIMDINLPSKTYYSDLK